jgi:hypothetical protein
MKCPRFNARDRLPTKLLAAVAFVNDIANEASALQALEGIGPSNL